MTTEHRDWPFLLSLPPSTLTFLHNLLADLVANQLRQISWTSALIHTSKKRKEKKKRKKKRNE